MIYPSRMKKPKFRMKVFREIFCLKSTPLAILMAEIFSKKDPKKIILKSGSSFWLGISYSPLKFKSHSPYILYEIIKWIYDDEKNY